MVCAWVIATACTVENDNDPFGAASVAQSTTLGTTASAGSGSDDTAGSSGGSGGSDAGGTSSMTTEVGSSGGGLDTTGDPVGTSDTTGGGGNGMQPADGMYAHCTTAEECGFNPVFCITISDAMGQPMDGFCSETGCANAAADCDPSPGGTATPICVMVTLNDMAQSACALDCSGGKTCPMPMTCYNVTGLGMVCA